MSNASLTLDRDTDFYPASVNLEVVSLWSMGGVYDFAVGNLRAVM